MYDYPHFKEAERSLVLKFMKGNPFVMLIGTDKTGRIELTQVPVLIREEEGRLFLTGHIARRTSHHKAFEENPEVVAVFSSPHSYVSASWYTGTPNIGSTWNYISVHARGKIKWMTEESLVELMKELTLHYENGNSKASPVYDNLPEEYTSKMIKGIVGFELEVQSLENVHKLSQNRDEKSYDNIMKELSQREGGAKYIAEMMQANKEKVFRPE